jgi:hypothetical protein
MAGRRASSGVIRPADIAGMTAEARVTIMPREIAVIHVVSVNCGGPSENRRNLTMIG